MPLYTVSTLAGTYSPERQTLFRNYAYHPDDPAIDSTAQSPTVAIDLPTSTYYITHDENTTRPAYTAQGISESGQSSSDHTGDLAVGKIAQSFYYPGNPAVSSMAQSPTMAVEVPALAKHCLTLDENTSMYSRVSDGSTVNWRCNFIGCPYVSRTKRDMERHCSNLSHGGCREHKCEYCGKVFVRADTLSRHVRETSCWLRQA
ncbi:hypothetical protein M378DRAFT_171176 [Amanita muscaria Koide BX008]|uniref:C2H2-type domain-containing protein n=1 Tax=Amanita muscaria (strain Koide BX008) TaxID=946122 RepID=A0A0C2S5G3_AMAMK|nr:hypothetical protein M378DRAFT_171176 [Amanita muscaria Koide BX008]